MKVSCLGKIDLQTLAANAAGFDFCGLATLSGTPWPLARSARFSSHEAVRLFAALSGTVSMARLDQSLCQHMRYTSSKL